MTEARAAAERIVRMVAVYFPKNVAEDMTDTIAAALTTAHAAGRRDMREEAAKCAELRAYVFGGEPTTENERQIVEHIIAAVRALPVEEG